MNNDTIVGIAGAVVLVAVMVGVFVYEYNNVPSDAAGGLVAVTDDGPEASGTTDVGSSTMETLELHNERVTNVTFTLTWTHQAAPDTLRFTVQGPNGIAPATSQAQDDGSITLTVPVPGGREDAQRAQGMWNVTVEFVSAEETDDGLPGGVDNPLTDPESDSSVSWTVKTKVEHYTTDQEAAPLP